jgi:hypothetical protein
MKVITLYLKIYGESFAAALGGLRKNLWTVLLPFGLLALMMLAFTLLGPLGFVGGIIATLALDALLSCYLYFVGEVVANTKVSLNEFRRSIGAYFWSIVNVNFVLFIARLLLETALAGNPKGPVIFEALWWAAVVALNATPEVMYQRGTYGGIETFRRSFQFLQENWLEWLVPNVALIIAANELFDFGRSMAGRYSVGLLGLGLLGGALIHVVMLFRGHLFKALDGTSHRQRMYRTRMGL